VICSLHARLCYRLRRLCSCTTANASHPHSSCGAHLVLPSDLQSDGAEWVASQANEESTNLLLSWNMLLERGLLGWRPGLTEEELRPRASEVVTFTSFHRGGFGIPTHPFFRGLLYFYGDCLHDLCTRSSTSPSSWHYASVS
jgi:hypothetical protein